jgi:Amt family ammonium transporter
MLSVLMQCTVIGAVVMLIWVVYGYSFAFGGSDSPIGAVRPSSSSLA